VSQELTALAEAGAAAVVAAMATDVWQRTRDGVLRLFGRAGPGLRAAAEARLDDDAALVGAATAPDEVRRALLAPWTQELAVLLSQDEAGRRALAELVAEVRAQLPGERRTPACEQTNTAHDSGTVIAVQHGDLHT